ncbi:MAG: flagellar biosynthesis protein FlhA [Ignavibacteriota bacterium]|jgi:flagellar biosynthesis protein FlhA|nr:MAG: flagellar biosynthesis protein FlhA [Ignavibacterium sp.]MBL1153657.1 flagellar biosynthesis protein FlhA [Ignavibacteriota bacterium]MCO6448211.1 flagellar biosynthesis protein FlhA [Ignavibacterium album]MCZ2267995.1 flagellar biosynthesis protein FlhA [Ignavibacteriales bacterium]MDX9711423.1 flagellar biosynthesis protein FlhA [Ignavibacteriaceae bacterium]
MKFFGRNTDIVLAFGLILMLGLMLIPLPPGFLDFFLALSITISVLIFVVSLFIQSPLDISIFPGLLLISTLFRLALNISSTRLILIDGYAGKVIETFGQFVVSGNYVVGFIIFIILLIVQFIVIVKGSGRISEVAARFTLDAMPGKQMAIDADLNTGLITEAEARKRRDNIAREAEFYGAMDGAGKFVKGDAIAGLIINVINIIGGFIIGIGQRGLEITDALQQYTILTIGDGLVTQIPALLIATAAGMVVTRSAAGTSLDSQIKLQLLANPRVLGIVATTVVVFSFLPGMPTIPFIMIGVTLGVTSFIKNKQKASEATVIEDEISSPEKGEEVVEQYLQVDPIEIEIGYGLISLVDESQGGNLFNKISTTRKFIALEFGVLIPPVRVRDNLQLSPNEYIIKIKGNIASTFEIHPDRFLAMNPGEIEDKIDGIPTKDPAFGLQSYWVTREEKDRAELLGFTVVDAISVLSTHLQETLKENFDKILSRQAVKQLLENLKKDYPAVIEDISADVLPLGTIQKVLQNLLKELIPIKDLVQIIEALIDYSKVTKNIDVLTEYVRHSLNNTIANLFKDGNGIIHAAAISEKLEAYITASFQNQKDAVQTLGLNPVMLSDLKNKMQLIVNKFDSLGYKPIFITSATIRPYFYRLINSSFPTVAVLSYTELPSQIEIEFIDNLELTNAY